LSNGYRTTRHRNILNLNDEKFEKLIKIYCWPYTSYPQKVYNLFFTLTLKTTRELEYLSLSISLFSTSAQNDWLLICLRQIFLFRHHYYDARRIVFNYNMYKLFVKIYPLRIRMYSEYSRLQTKICFEL